MVSCTRCEPLVLVLLLAAQPVEPVLERLDPPRRAAVVMALIGIAITGLFLVACVMLGANWVRRMARQSPRSPRTETEAPSAAENRNLRESLRDMLPRVDTKDTIHIDRATGETKIDP